MFLPVYIKAQESPATLSKRLTANCLSDKEKVSVLFRWVADSISYRIRGAKVRTSSVSIKKEKSNTVVKLSDSINKSPIKPLNERVSEDVLRNRLAVCDGYTRLFKTLCDYAGIRCEIISGYGRTDDNKPNARFGVNHNWNAVWLDSSWHLADVTWASGYVTESGDRFINSFDSTYFLTPPEDFIKDHFPDDPRWTLLPDNYVPGEFAYSPFKQKAYTKYPISAFWPKKGIIDASCGDTIRLSIISKYEKGRVISPDLIADTSWRKYLPASVFLKPARSKIINSSSQLIEFDYSVTNPSIKWLFLVYNDDLLVRYKINIKMNIRH
jgi:hypothetical protein